MEKNKWIPRFFYKKYDGGKESGVIGYMLIEWKPLFSIGLLRFNPGSREAYHSHAFNALTWWLKGSVTEITRKEKGSYTYKNYYPSIAPKYTKRKHIHKVISDTVTWALTFRGPWEDYWKEFRPQEGEVILTHGRKIVS